MPNATTRGDRTGETVARSDAAFLNPSPRVIWIGFATVALSLLSAFLTFMILTGLTPIVPRNEVVVTALVFNAALIIALIVLVAWQIGNLVEGWKTKIAGARLYTRIVALFSVIAVLPAMLLAIGATISFSRSLDSWFSDRVRAIIAQSVNVAQTYIEEHGQNLRTEIVAMARDIDSASSPVHADPVRLSNLLTSQAALRDIPAAYLIDSDGKAIIRAVEDKRLPFTTPTRAALVEAEQGQVPLSLSREHKRLSAIVRLERLPDRFLYVSRPVSTIVARHLERTQQFADEYTHIRRTRGGLKWAHALMYATISMTALLAAIWSGMWFAGRFVAPISRLIGAAQDVSKGDLHVALPERRGEGDLRRLSQNFNTMTRELRHQRNALVTANDQLQQRRRFIEAIFSGTSAGIIGLDADDRITLVSRSAEDLLSLEAETLIGNKLVEAIPEFAEVYEKASSPTVKPRAQHQITITSGTSERTLALQVTREAAEAGAVGSVVTFDDISELVVAQRTNAWADVARRIAHEIKNPLTPIILSVGRLRKNYGHLITEKKELFENLTGTIERQAGDIKTMVDEFAAFARMPDPQMATTDLRDAVKEPVILFKEGNQDVTYTLDLPSEPVACSIDRRLITQAVTNLIKNATEAIQGIGREGEGKTQSGHVTTTVRAEENRTVIEVTDNGPGLPKQNRNRITEPYVTTKGHKGTGLGLAMVKKIAEQHGGTLILEDVNDLQDDEKDEQTGARVTIILPPAIKPETTPEREASKAQPAQV